MSKINHQNFLSLFPDVMEKNTRYDGLNICSMSEFPLFFSKFLIANINTQKENSWKSQRNTHKQTNIYLIYPCIVDVELVSLRG